MSMELNRQRGAGAGAGAARSSDGNLRGGPSADGRRCRDRRKFAVAAWLRLGPDG